MPVGAFDGRRAAVAFGAPAAADRARRALRAVSTRVFFASLSPHTRRQDYFYDARTSGRSPWRRLDIVTVLGLAWRGSGAQAQAILRQA